jgi:palmitoyltransferase ZDHHC13/17
VYNCIGINNHRHFFFYLIYLTMGIIVYDSLLYYCESNISVSSYLENRGPLTSATDFGRVSADASDQCSVLSASLCKIVNSDPYALILAMWVTLQLSWVFMLLFVQFIQVSRAMTTYENMYGVHDASITSAFTSTGAPLDPNHPSLGPQDGVAGGRHHHSHKGGWLKQWGRILGVEPFLETVTGRGAATGKKNKKKKNPYSRGCVSNCKDFWFDPAPVFGRRENGAAVLGGEPVNYTEMYESPRMMELRGRGSRRTGGYEAVADEEV